MKKPIIIAELGSVHDGSIGNCINLIKCAKENGANIVKLQHHISEEETLKDAPNPKYFKSENRYEYFKRTSFNKEEWIKIINYCKKINIDFMCSVFSLASFKFLIKLGVKNIKIPSGELNNTHLLKKISLNKKIKVFISTGMSNWKEISNAVSILNQNKLVIFQCTSLYPCPIDHVGINVFKELKKKFPKHEIGFSDHTIGNVAAILALSAGSEYFEKHLTFSNYMYGSDAKLASEPNIFKQYCCSLNEAYKVYISKVDKNDLKPFREMRKVFQKSLYYKANIKKNQILKENLISFKKPAKGIPANGYLGIINRRLKKNVKKDQIIRFSDLKN